MRGSMARAGTAAIGALLGAACGPAPYSLGPEEPAAVVVVEEAKVAAEPAPPPAREREDRWIPDGYPRLNPFADKRTWVGEYDCPQGRTSLALRVVDAHGQRMRAIFDFHHAPTDASGQFLLAGEFDEQTGHVVFTPGAWIIHPDNYVTVGMEGQVSRDGKHFVGRILAEGCGAFRLRAAQ
jgi:hypothetical protein